MSDQTEEVPDHCLQGNIRPTADHPWEAHIDGVARSDVSRLISSITAWKQFVGAGAVVRLTSHVALFLYAVGPRRHLIHVGITCLLG